MGLGINEVKIIVDNQISVYLPKDSIDLELYRCDFDLTSIDFAQRRLIYKTQRFDAPLKENDLVLEKVRAGRDTAHVYVNDFLVLTGVLVEYNTDEVKNYVTFGVVSSIKELTDFLDDSALYLDVYDFKNDNFFISGFSDAKSTDLVKFGEYSPLDKNAGALPYNQTTIDQYCQPSLCLVNLFQRVFSLKGWNANWGFFNTAPNNSTDIILKNIVWTPTSNYLVSSFGAAVQTGSITVPTNSSVKIPFSSLWNVNGSAVFNADNTITVLSPARLMQFKMLGSVSSTAPVYMTFGDGVDTFMQMAIETPTKVRQYSTWFNPIAEGMNAVYLEITNDSNVDAIVSFEGFKIYNLVSVYENDQFNLLNNMGYYYPISDNYPSVTVMDVFRQFLAQFQIAFNVKEFSKQVEFYYINNIPNRQYGSYDVSDKLEWGGYAPMAEHLESSGIAKFNAIKNKNDQKRQAFFNIDLKNLPAKAVYFESFFGSADDDRIWGSVCVPSGKKKVKEINGNFVSYLSWEETDPLLTYYKNGKVSFSPISINAIVRGFWSNILGFLTSVGGKNPTVFRVKISVSLYEYLENLSQNKLITYNGIECLIMEGTYKVQQQAFEGVLLALK